MPLPTPLDLSTIRNRRRITEDGISKVNLTDQIIEYRTQLQIAQSPIRVTKEFEGRPDLIAKLVYGSEDYTDLLLFFNNIPNPFSLQRGQVLVIYSLESMMNNLRDPREEEEGNTSKEAFSQKLPEKDRERVKQKISKEQNVPAESAEVRPPNIAPDGTSPTEVQDGQITLGTNVSRCKDELSGTQRLSERIRGAVKERVRQRSQQRQQEVTPESSPTVSQEELNRLRDTQDSSEELGGASFEDLQ